MFIDRAIIEVNGGAGGSGSEAYRREKGVPRGGPAGGDGGDGGDVIILADIQLSTFMDFRYRKHHKAERGRKIILLKGDVPSPITPPPGCPFHTRCQMATEECSRVAPQLRKVQHNHWVACDLV